MQKLQNATISVVTENIKMKKFIKTYKRSRSMNRKYEKFLFQTQDLKETYMSE